MPILSRKTWVVIADGEKALLLRNLKNHPYPDLQVVAKEEQENPSDGDQKTDRPGRRADGGTHQKSTMTEADWHNLAKDRFAKELSDLLYKHAHSGAFERLILVASPQVLGVLRADLHANVADLVIAEIPKTLTNHPLDKIEELLKAELDKL